MAAIPVCVGIRSAGTTNNLTAIPEDQLPHIVQKVVHLRMRQVVELNLACHRVDAAGDMAIGLDEQRSYPPCDGTRGDLRQIVGAKLFGSGCPEHFDQSRQAREIMRLDGVPRAVATADFLAGNIVSNDLAGPPGHGIVLDLDWADGLVPDSNLIRWVGAPTEITR